nr:acyl-CoA desaturase [Pseudenhygromyxa sp. WMMC2535]
MALIGATPAWVLLGSINVGLAVGGMGMSIQHDGGHRAFASTRRGNWWAAAVLDFLGASSYVWRVKHGVVHHTFPNVEGADDDIELGALARMSPGQPRYAFHRLQFVYLPLLYGFITFKWFLWDDYRDLLRGKVGAANIAMPRGAELALFIAGKVAHLGWGLVLPVIVLGWAWGLAFYVVAFYLAGFVLALVFQLAHCVEEAEFISLAPSEHIERGFAQHQLATTVDFARENPWLTWYVGGLNFQAVHHLFPRISHVHYPELAGIVETCCAEYGVRYHASPSLRAAVTSHLRWLWRMGQPVADASPGRLDTLTAP